MQTQNNKIGYWMKDSNGLPCFNYTGSIPYSAYLPNKQKVKLSDDPWFLLGNDQLTLFTHISGQYELITGQRAWGRMNQGNKPNTGANHASLAQVNDKGEVIEKYQLTGLASLAADPNTCKRVFGCGFANYTYQADSITVQRILSVKPSTAPGNGTSGFLLTIKIKNNSSEKANLIYSESITVNYETMQQQRSSDDAKKVRYVNMVSINEQEQYIKADIKGVTDDPLLFPSKESISMYEGYPPALFMKALTAGSIFEESANELSVKHSVFLKPAEEKTLEMIVGYSFEKDFSSVNQITKELSMKSIEATQNENFCSESAYSGDWLKILPKFEDESDLQLRQELVWHAYNLEAMATYSEYYGETKIPQGTIYDYDWGQHASARDNFQHALPLVYYNPEVAKSTMRYMLKRTTPWGEIRLIEMGNGFANNHSYFTSDQQLFFFLLLSEYLRVTHDYEFLSEAVECFPVTNMHKITVLKFVEKCFTFLRDEIGTGSHGLVRLMNSDWNDAVFYTEKVPYNKVLYTGESHMNSAMAVTILGSLISELHRAENIQRTETSKLDIQNITKSMDLFRTKVLKAFMTDLGERSFSRRMYFNGRSYGDENMFLEPQGYMLQMVELSEERKRALYDEMKKRVYADEKLGAREQQTPEFEGDGWEKGSRENGGFWYALNGPVIIGVAQYDKMEAMRLLKRMTFEHYSKSFPDYWSSYWSAADNIESSLIPEEGLPDQTWNYSAIPVYCAHAHAWILYCYYVINGK